MSPQGASLVRMPIVMAAAMYGTLLSAPFNLKRIDL
jgi:hypothetical protein